MSSLMWFRRDLRLRDNPALLAACAAGPVIPIYIDDPADRPGGASRWWLQHSLEALQADLQQRGLRLVIRRGEPGAVLRGLLDESGAQAIHWNRLYEPAQVTRDKALQNALPAQSHSAALLREPWELATQTGKPYQVFTPFYRALQAQGPSRESQGLPRAWPAPSRWPKSLALKDLGLLPKVSWAQGFTGQPGEAGALRALKRFLESAADRYALDRDRPDRAGTSRLSPHLHFGELSAVQIWQAAQGSAAFVRELAWRDFSHHLIYHFPFTATRALRPDFDRLAWRKDPQGLKAWQRGMTGYPIVDAGLRELWATGFMHNRVRMIVGSFLVKDLLVDWRQGAAWFMDTLVDADLAQNTLGWQWVAGCGADAAPFFRIFNPVLQGQKFDPQGAYVRRWVPELAKLPDKWVHQPWAAPSPPADYPSPIVDHAQARLRALAALQGIKKGAQT